MGEKSLKSMKKFFLVINVTPKLRMQRAHRDVGTGGARGYVPPRFWQFSTKIVLLCPPRISDLKSLLLRAPQNFRPSYVPD